jgi:site-specific DNA recombinase
MTTRTAIYARYSSDRQSETSAEDQARLCADFAARQGWHVTDTFADAAMSGATRARPGLQQLLARAADFDIVLAESLDRISRSLEDTAAIFSRLRFAGVRLFTVAEGEISDLHVGLKGTMAQMFLKDLGDKTRRGQAGRVRSGAVPGGLCYGYRKRVELDGRGEPIRGLRQIEPREAEIIRRIFADYAAGQSPRAIAAALNAAGIPGPAGGVWRATTIHGHAARGTGILCNPLYIGRIVFNRQRFLRDPETRRRISRPNDASERIEAEAPDLRIVSDELWQAAAARRADLAKVKLPHRRRPKRLLSGLVKCGVCGGPYIVIGTESWGCAHRRDSNSCSNRGTITTGPLERRVIAAIRDELLHPHAIAAFVETYDQARTVINAAGGRRREELAQDLAKAEARVARLVEAIAEGAASFADVKAQLAKATATRDDARAALDRWRPDSVIRLHGATGARFRRQLDQISAALATTAPIAEDLRTALRAALVEVIASPAQSGRGVDLQLAVAMTQALNKKSPPASGRGAIYVSNGCGDTLPSLRGVVRIAA